MKIAFPSPPHHKIFIRSCRLLRNKNVSPWRMSRVNWLCAAVQLLNVHVTSSKKHMLTKNVIDWLNELPDDCVIDLALLNRLADEEAGLLDKLDHEVYSMYVYDQVLSEKALSSILNLAPNELSFRGIGFVTNNSFVGVPAINVDLLRISKSNFSESDMIDLLNATNPKNLSLFELAPITPEVFGLIFSLERLEGLSTQVSWLTTQHLESLGLSETLQWASIANSGIPEDKFEKLRTASPTVRINGKSGCPD